MRTPNNAKEAYDLALKQYKASLAPQLEKSFGLSRVKVVKLIEARPKVIESGELTGYTSDEPKTLKKFKYVFDSIKNEKTIERLE